MISFQVLLIDCITMPCMLSWCEYPNMDAAPVSSNGDMKSGVENWIAAVIVTLQFPL